MDRSDPDAAAPAMDTATVKAWLWAFAVQTPEHAILLLDAGMTVLWANPGAAEILGQPVVVAPAAVPLRRGVMAPVERKSFVLLAADAAVPAH